MSPVILLFVGMCLSIFSFDVWDKLWVRIRSVPGASLLIKFVVHSNKLQAHSEYQQTNKVKSGYRKGQLDPIPSNCAHVTIRKD